MEHGEIRGVAVAWARRDSRGCRGVGTERFAGLPWRGRGEVRGFAEAGGVGAVAVYSVVSLRRRVWAAAMS